MVCCLGCDTPSSERTKSARLDLKSTRSKSSTTRAKGWNQSAAGLLARDGGFSHLLVIKAFVFDSIFRNNQWINSDSRDGEILRNFLEINRNQLLRTILGHLIRSASRISDFTQSLSASRTVPFSKNSLTVEYSQYCLSKSNLEIFS